MNGSWVVGVSKRVARSWKKRVQFGSRPNVHMLQKLEVMWGLNAWSAAWIHSERLQARACVCASGPRTQSSMVSRGMDGGGP